MQDTLCPPAQQQKTEACKSFEKYNDSVTYLTRLGQDKDWKGKLPGHKDAVAGFSTDNIVLKAGRDVLVPVLDRIIKIEATK